MRGWKRLAFALEHGGERAAKFDTIFRECHLRDYAGVVPVRVSPPGYAFKSTYALCGIAGLSAVTYDRRDHQQWAVWRMLVNRVATGRRGSPVDVDRPWLPDAAPLDVWDSAFPELTRSLGLSIDHVTRSSVERGETEAALFAYRLLWCEPTVRREFIGRLNSGNSGFVRWISGAGGVALGLSRSAREMLVRTFAHSYGEHVYNVYLNNPELQQLYPIGLLPAGQAHFFSWLTRHGRCDHGISEGEIVWFLVRSREELGRSLALTYLIRPDLQRMFPNANTSSGWRQLTDWYLDSYPQFDSAWDVEFPPAKVFHLASGGDIPADRRARRGKQRIEGVNVISHFCNPSGIQQAALWTKASLERAGLKTSCRDVPVPRKTIAEDRADWLGLEIYPATILTHAATPYFITAYERAGLHRRDDVYRIAYWAWELERVPNDWVEAALLVDEIWTPTPFVAAAMRAIMPRPVYEMLPGVEVGATELVDRIELGLSPDHFVFLFLFDLHSQIHRKNPAAVVAAFEKAFRRSDKATLVIKVTGGDIFQADLKALRRMCQVSNVTLIDELMSRSRAYGLLAMCDCFVSLHRSEGFGLGMAEAMLLGKPVIATGYSGNLAFMNKENSMLVDYEMVEIAEDRPIYTRGNRWAEPSIEKAAEYMRYVYENREEAAAKAVRVQPQIGQLLSLNAAGYRMQQRLQQIGIA